MVEREPFAFESASHPGHHQPRGGGARAEHRPICRLLDDSGRSLAEARDAEICSSAPTIGCTRRKTAVEIRVCLTRHRRSSAAASWAARIALRLAQAGREVLVLERAIPGAEASSAAAADPRRAGGIGRAGSVRTTWGCARGRCFPPWPRSCATRPASTSAIAAAACCAPASAEADETAAQARYAWQRDAGMRRVAPRRRPRAPSSPASATLVRAGLHFPDDAPGRAAARTCGRCPWPRPRAGATFRDRRVRAPRGLTRAPACTGVELDGEIIRPARHVVVAAGSWSSLVEGAGAGRRARSGRCAARLSCSRPARRAVRGVVTGPGGYLVGRADGRVLAARPWSSPATTRRSPPAGCATCSTCACALVPSLAERAGDRHLGELPPVHRRRAPPLLGRDAGRGPATSPPATSATASCSSAITAEIDPRPGAARDHAARSRPFAAGRFQLDALSPSAHL